MIEMALENYPKLTLTFADIGYTGDTLRTAMTDITGHRTEGLRRPPGVTGFAIIAQHRVVE